MAGLGPFEKIKLKRSIRADLAHHILNYDPHRYPQDISLPNLSLIASSGDNKIKESLVAKVAKKMGVNYRIYRNTGVLIDHPDWGAVFYHTNNLFKVHDSFGLPGVSLKNPRDLSVVFVNDTETVISTGAAVRDRINDIYMNEYHRMIVHTHSSFKLDVVFIPILMGILKAKFDSKDVGVIKNGYIIATDTRTFKVTFVKVDFGTMWNINFELVKM